LSVLLEQLLRDVRVFQSAILREEGQPDTVVLASKLAAVGYKLVIRTALGGGSGRACFHNLHHEFLVVSGDPEFGSPEDKQFVIDPHFRYFDRGPPCFEPSEQDHPAFKPKLEECLSRGGAFRFNVGSHYQQWSD
jgi:hypothetical protein